MQPRKQTAVLYDPFPIFLDAVERLLAGIDVEVVAKTISPKRALAILDEKKPALLVSELHGPEGTLDGIDLVREARCRVPSLKIVILSSESERHRMGAAFDAGASAYVLKTAHPEELAAAIKQAFSDTVYFAGSIPLPEHSRRRDSSELQGLTRRELEILRLVSEGHSNSELAKMLWVTEQTVKFHLSNIYRKLNVSNRTEASRWAQLHGMLSQTAATPDQASIVAFERKPWLSRAS
jgi:DNA-binding NarL/FixJ family response regulator